MAFNIYNFQPTGEKSRQRVSSLFDRTLHFRLHHLFSNTNYKDIKSQIFLFVVPLAFRPFEFLTDRVDIQFPPPNPSRRASDVDVGVIIDAAKHPRHVIN
jgi:hypothetical protein